MKRIKTDSDLVQVARQIDNHLDAIRNLIEDLHIAEHPGAQTFIDGLEYNGLTAFAWATHIVSDALTHPERWETNREDGIRYKRGVKDWFFSIDRFTKKQL